MLSSFASNAIIGLLALEAVNGAVVTQISDGQIQNSPISVKVSGSAAATTSSSSQTSTSICPAPTNSAGLLTDINIINKYWGQVSPYFDNTEDHFGVEYVGLPDGCQIEQAHTLQRHANRFPISEFTDGPLQMTFAAKAKNSTGFTGPLSFLNTYTYIMSDSGLLNNLGATTEFAQGASFWNRYGRTIYNATVAQVAYNASFVNGTSRPKPVLRTTSQSRIQNSQINWALGFFGPSFSTVADPTLANASSEFEVVVITEGGTENNTLAAYDSCIDEYATDEIGYLGDNLQLGYMDKYLVSATARMQQYAPADFTFTTNDTFAMQLICAYETTYIGMSDFCNLFSPDEWAGFENSLDIQYYFDYAYGNPTGRAQGIGYLQELLARLQKQYIPVSNSSVNSTLDNNGGSFPLYQPFYADFSHDDIIISVLTAMSLDYLKDSPSLTQYPPDPDRHFVLSHLTPFGGHLITEVIGCSSANPSPVEKSRVAYTPGQYGYNPANASHKFIRMRLNNGVLPLASIRGGLCAGRLDGMCSVEDFIASQKGSDALANYQYACFGNWTVPEAEVMTGMDFDGTITA